MFIGPGGLVGQAKVVPQLFSLEDIRGICFRK